MFCIDMLFQNHYFHVCRITMISDMFIRVFICVFWGSALKGRLELLFPTFEKKEEHRNIIFIFFFRRVSESDIVMPEEARSVGRELNIPYYETSVLTYFGIDEVFENAIRAALCCRRQQSLFRMTRCVHVKKTPTLKKSQWFRKN